jgi:hypothetical protein
MSASGALRPWSKSHNGGKLPFVAYSESDGPSQLMPDLIGPDPSLACADNERPPPQPHSPVCRPLHAGRRRRHDRLGDRWRTKVARGILRPCVVFLPSASLV